MTGGVVVRLVTPPGEGSVEREYQLAEALFVAMHEQHFATIKIGELVFTAHPSYVEYQPTLPLQIGVTS